MADMMVIRADGSVRTSGWTYHNRRRADPAVAEVRSPAPKTRQAILAAIRATSARHATNRSLARVGLSATDWQILFRAMIEAESSYNPVATSPKGAYGLGQLMPATARSLGVDRTDPAQNLEGAARYLLTQLAEFRDIELALAAYNAGPHRVREYGGIPPFKETRNYITRIHRIRARLSGQPIEQPITRVAPRRTTHPQVVIDLNSGVSSSLEQNMFLNSRSQAALHPTR